MSTRFAKAPVTAALLITIAIVFAFEVLTGAIRNGQVLYQMGAIVPDMLQKGQYWRILAAMFLHADFVHWIANSWALYQLGTLYEAMFGSKRFALVYFASGAAASVASSMFTRGLSVGASGAILGVLGAFIFSIRRSPQYRNEPWTKGLISQLLFWAGLNIVLGFSVEYIDNTAHIAGLVTGLILGLIPHRVPPPPPNRGVIDVQAYEDSLPPQNQP